MLLTELHKTFVGINNKQKLEVTENLGDYDKGMEIVTTKSPEAGGPLFDLQKWIAITIDHSRNCRRLCNILDTLERPHAR
jgi:hypothetical protein